MGFRNKIMKEYENIVLCGYPVQFLFILDNFCINRKLNFKKVSLYKPPLTRFWPCPAKQQGIFLSFHLRGKTNRQMLCIKGGRKGDKNWRKHVRARYTPVILTLAKITLMRLPLKICQNEGTLKIQKYIWKKASFLELLALPKRTLQQRSSQKLFSPVYLHKPICLML